MLIPNPIFMATYSVGGKYAKSLDRPNTGDVWLWAGNPTSLCSASSFVKWGNLKGFLWRFNELTLVKWLEDNRCREGARDVLRTVGHSTVGCCVPHHTLCRSSLTGMQRSMEILEFERARRNPRSHLSVLSVALNLTHILCNPCIGKNKPLFPD